MQSSKLNHLPINHLVRIAFGVHAVLFIISDERILIHKDQCEHFIMESLLKNIAGSHAIRLLC